MADQISTKRYRRSLREVFLAVDVVAIEHGTMNEKDIGVCVTKEELNYSVTHVFGEFARSDVFTTHFYHAESAVDSRTDL